MVQSLDKNPNERELGCLAGIDRAECAYKKMSREPITKHCGESLTMEGPQEKISKSHHGVTEVVGDVAIMEPRRWVTTD